ncbi:MAG: asparagine synthase (glutamine-hydrolyzing) [Actinomycetota bacterium]|nr:asparagine synthase (glutamine-hydrolyzing) [Actinomycetota bacterium]
MCGIVGGFCVDGFDADAAETAIETIHHRGPDEQGRFTRDGVFLGICRLSIIDVAGGRQPMWNDERSCCIVYNGELYNFRELRAQLESHGHVFRTRSDTEVVLLAYQQWGRDCLTRMNGMFALAIWDARSRTLFLARDRIGEKPLYYYSDASGRFVFASEIKAIVADRSIPRRVDIEGLANFMTFGHAVAPVTMFQGVKKLLPGHFLVASEQGVSLSQYWDVGDEPQVDGSVVSEQDAAARVRALLEDSVRRRMIADVPVGAFLSGGVDSSAIVALMTRSSHERVKTFSLGFDAGGQYDELAAARVVAEHFGTDHNELRAEHVDLVHTLRTLVYHYDEPFGDPAGFPVYLLSQLARQHVKVVLTGDGGDELFGGYRRYAADQGARLYQRLLPGALARWIPRGIGYVPRARRLKKTMSAMPVTDEARRYATWMQFFTPEARAELLAPVWDRVGDYDPAWSYDEYYGGLRSTAADHLNRLMYVDLKTWLPDMYMEKTDKATMACSLEGRLPLLDHRLVELAFQIPGKYKIRGLSTKRVLKRAVAGLVPPSVLRRRKHGFSVPTDPWFRGSLKQFAREVILDRRTLDRGYLDPSAVRRMWKEHAEGRHVWDAQLWLLLNLELWQRLYLDGEGV